MTERRRVTPLALLRRIFAKLTGSSAESPWKKEKHTRDPFVTVDASPSLV
jgi:hypothetical protein